MTDSERELVIEFGMWLTTRDKVIAVGASETVYAMTDALTEFLALKESTSPTDLPTPSPQ